MDWVNGATCGLVSLGIAGIVLAEWLGLKWWHRR